MPAPGARSATVAGVGPLDRLSAAGALTTSADGAILSISIVPLLVTFIITVTWEPTTPITGAVMLAINEPPGTGVAVCVTVNVCVLVRVTVAVLV